MEEKKKQNPKLKLALAIAIPVMVMVVTISMVGASFAWFTDQATAEIATISLTTRDVFTLVFTVDPNDEVVKYQGETAIAYTKSSKSSSTLARYLINDYRARSVYEYETDAANYLYYIQDAPFKFKTTVNLNTDDRYVDMNINFDTVNISKASKDTSNNTITTVLASYGEGLSVANSYASSDIPYCFTWFMKKNGVVENKYYTPYGVIEYAVDSTSGFEYATKLNNTSVTASTTLVGKTASGMTNFYTDGIEKYDIYVVFCPEKLYWMQYFQADRDKSLEQVYSSTEINKIVSSGYPNQLYYSASSFWGSTFSFVADMTVSRVDWTQTVSGGEEE